MSHTLEKLTSTDSGMSEFRECLTHLRDGHPEEAILHVRRALELAPTNPFYLSYAGLLAAAAEKRFADAETLCQEALGMRHNHAQLYLNLAEVYQMACRPRDAIQVLEKGWVSTGRDFRILRALKTIGTRRQPTLSFLQRTHPLNRMLGKWRHRLIGPSRTAERDSNHSF